MPPWWLMWLAAAPAPEAVCETERVQLVAAEAEVELESV